MKLCTYCGDLANTRDHIIPVSYTHGFRVFLGTKWVWCCRECNTLLGNKMFDGIAGKAEYLYYALIEKHQRKALTPSLIDRVGPRPTKRKWVRTNLTEPTEPPTRAVADR